MATHIVQFQNPGPRGGEYNVPVTAAPGASNEQIITAATGRANRPLAKLNRLGGELGTNPTVHTLDEEAGR